MVQRRHRFAPAQDTWLVSAAAHDEASARRAARAGVDLILLSPVFPTNSHPGRPALGPASPGQGLPQHFRAGFGPWAESARQRSGGF